MFVVIKDKTINMAQYIELKIDNNTYWYKYKYKRSCITKL